MRKGILGRDLFRFIATGCFNTGLSFVVYVVGLFLGLGYLVANGVAWTIGVIVGYLLNSAFVFRRSVGLKRFQMFFLLNLLSLCVSMLMLTLLIKQASLSAVVAAIFVIPVVVVFNFIAGKFIVFV